MSSPQRIRVGSTAAAAASCHRLHTRKSIDAGALHQPHTLEAKRSRAPMTKQKEKKVKAADQAAKAKRKHPVRAPVKCAFPIARAHAAWKKAYPGRDVSGKAVTWALFALEAAGEEMVRGVMEETRRLRKPHPEDGTRRITDDPVRAYLRKQKQLPARFVGEYPPPLPLCGGEIRLPHAKKPQQA